MNIIVRCGCGGIQKYIESSIALLGLPVPCETLVGKEKIRKLAALYPGTPFAEHLQAIAKKSGRYAFYISTDHTPGDTENQNITAMYNLITGKKVY